MQHSSAAPHLVRIMGLSQCLTVGLGAAVASVRTLTEVSLTVHAGELVVLSDTRGAGERALLSVIAGDRRGVTGSCEINPSVSVRLVCIHAQAALALTQEWARAALAEQSGQCTAAYSRRELFLFDVARAGVPAPVIDPSLAKAPKPWNENRRAALLNWSVRCQQHGAAVIVAAGHALGNSLFRHALAHREPHVFERSTGTASAPLASGSQPDRGDPAAVFERPVSALSGSSPTRAPLHPASSSALHPVRSTASSSAIPSPVRVVLMHSGRLAPTVRLDSADLAGW